MNEMIIPGADGRASIVSDTSEEQFDLLVDLIAENLAPSSQRVYRHTYEQWRAYTIRNQFDVFDLNFENLSAFLNGHDLASATRCACSIGWRNRRRAANGMRCSGGGCSNSSKGRAWRARAANRAANGP